MKEQPPARRRQPASIESSLATRGRPERQARLAAVRTLARSADPRAVRFLARALGDADSAVREAAACGLGQAGGRAAVRVLLRVLDDPHPEVRSTACGALGRSGDPRAIPGLTQLLTAESEIDVFLSASAALRRLADTLGSSRRRAAVAPLAALLGRTADGSDGELQIAVIRALGRIGDRRALPALLECVARPDKLDWRILDALAESLADLGDPRAVDALARALAPNYGRGNGAQREGALVFPPHPGVARALARLGGPRAAQALTAALTKTLHLHPNADYFHAIACEGLGRFGDATCVRPLLHLARSSGYANGFAYDALRAVLTRALRQIENRDLVAIAEQDDVAAPLYSARGLLSWHRDILRIGHPPARLRTRCERIAFARFRKLARAELRRRAPRTSGNGDPTGRSRSVNPRRWRS